MPIDISEITSSLEAGEKLQEQIEYVEAIEKYNAILKKIANENTEIKSELTLLEKSTAFSENLPEKAQYYRAWVLYVKAKFLPEQYPFDIKLKIIEESISLFSKNYLVHRLKSEVLFERIRQRQGDNVSQLNNDDKIKALSAVNKAYELKKNNVDLLYFRAQIYIFFKEHENAVKSLDVAIKGYQNLLTRIATQIEHQKTYIAYKKQYVTALRYRAFESIEINKFDTIINDVNEIEKNISDTLQIKEEMATNITNKALESFYQRDYKQAKQRVDLALTLNPNDIKAGKYKDIIEFEITKQNAPPTTSISAPILSNGTTYYQTNPSASLTSNSSHMWHANNGKHEQIKITPISPLLPKHTEEKNKIQIVLEEEADNLTYSNDTENSTSKCFPCCCVM